MMWSMPNTWGYALTTVGMMLFWILVVFGVIVLAQHLGRVNPPAVGRTPLIRRRPGRSSLAKSTRRAVSSISVLRHYRAGSEPSADPEVRPASG